MNVNVNTPCGANAAMASRLLPTPGNPRSAKAMGTHLRAGAGRVGYE
jgi:hypothetical protein